MRIDILSDPTSPPAWLALCKGLNPQLQELWHSRGWDLEAQLAPFILSPCPWCPPPSRTWHPCVPLSLGWDLVIHTRLLWDTSGESQQTGGSLGRRGERIMQMRTSALMAFQDF